MIKNVLDQIMGVDEASELWSLTPGHIKNLCAQGKLQARKVGNTWIIAKDQESPKQRERKPVKERLWTDRAAIPKLTESSDDIENILPLPLMEAMSALILAREKEINDERSRMGNKLKAEREKARRNKKTEKNK